MTPETRLPSTNAELLDLIKQGETIQVEFKLDVPRPLELAERICGMANTRSGGAIFFGIEDGTGKVIGVKNPSTATDTILQSTRTVKPSIKLDPVEPVLYNFDKATIIGIRIPPNNGTLYQAGKAFLIRKGSHTLALSAEEIETHLNTYGSLKWERNICNRATLKDLDPALLERYLSLRSERSRRTLRHISQEELLVGLECAVKNPLSGELVPTNAGMLMFGYDPQMFIPQSEVVCIRYGDTLGVKKYIDRKNFSGTLPELIDQTESFIKLHTKVGAKIVNFKRQDLPQYPIEALREAVVNAIVHRDYSRVGETVRIFYYEDRVEIHSPGLLLPEVPLTDLVKMTAPSHPRNPLLAQFLRDIPGYMERVGSGIRLIINEMRQMGLSEPEFIEQHEFLVIFRSGQEIDSGESTNSLNPRQLIGLKLVHTNGSITNLEYRAATKVSEATALRDLREMVELEILTTRGNKRSQRYFLP